MKRIFLLLLLSFSLYSQDSIDQIEKLYKNKEYEKALDMLSRVKLNQFNTDDALYLVGKIKQKDGKLDEAINNFSKIIYEYPKSSKYKLAILNSIRIYNKKDKWSDTIKLVKPLNLSKNSGNNNKILSIYGYANYRLALKNDSYGKIHLIKSGIEALELVLPRTSKKKDAVTLAKLYAIYIKSGYSHEDLKRKHDKLYRSLKSKYKVRDYTLNYIKNINKVILKQNRLDKKIDLLATYSNSINLSSKLNIDKVINKRNHVQKRISTKLIYDPFNYKSFNFEDKSSDQRHIQWTFSGDTYFKYSKGDKDLLNNSFKIKALYGIAENIEDNFTGIRGYHNFIVKPNSYLKLSINSKVGTTIFYNYLKNNNKIDYSLFNIKPVLAFSFNKQITISAKNSFSYKGYHQAKYSNSDYNRFYLYYTPSLELEYDNNYLHLDASIHYETLKTFHYNKEITTTSVTEIINSYGDYVEPKVSLGIKFAPNKTIAVNTKASYSMRDYINNKARSIENEFTGDLRKDSELNIQMGSTFKVNKNYTILFEYMYSNKSSNMKYDEFFITNLNYQIVKLGLSIKL